MGRLWKFDDTIDTDILAPGFYMKAPLPEFGENLVIFIRATVPCPICIQPSVAWDILV